MNMVFQKHILIPIDSVFPLHSIRDAHHKMESGDYFGKIVLSMEH
jgi:NADPH:quinone reductase-like Zn-dependent oxidoreductase